MSVQINVEITLLPDLIRALCTTEQISQCQAMTSKTIQILAPISPIEPVVVINIPQVISACNSLVIKLTDSSGAAGRPWSSLNFKVSVFSSNNIDNNIISSKVLEMFLNHNYTISPPTPVPSFLLMQETTYSIQVTLCNFLYVCGSATASIYVDKPTNVLPLVSISRANQQTTYRTSAFILNAYAYTQSCNGIISYSNLFYSWNVKEMSSSYLA